MRAGGNAAYLKVEKKKMQVVDHVVRVFLPPEFFTPEINKKGNEDKKRKQARTGKDERERGDFQIYNHLFI
ncbi:hypothetical protein DM01DRAFT_1196839 [Hesseltinella vesiculosa]|uniref:Uncharacterized protein n=1 Tax=Hesseltinella vesiculosa TaxID=101127 RepID=A0A1X2G3C4_9FUNG|nr:hypothetical protein DM01DRAFT_1196839 [Hesseltinella vesiculosa]